MKQHLLDKSWTTIAHLHYISDVAFQYLLYFTSIMLCGILQLIVFEIIIKIKITSIL